MIGSESLRGFFVAELGPDLIANSLDITGKTIIVTGQTTEAFLLETRSEISDERIRGLLGHYFGVAPGKIVAGKIPGMIWINRNHRPKMIVLLGNLSNTPGSARHFGGSSEYAGVEVNPRILDQNVAHIDPSETPQASLKNFEGRPSTLH